MEQGNRKMKWNAAHTVSAVAALALAAVLAGQAHADCGESQRMSHQSADCLRAEIKPFGNGKVVEVQNLCPSYGQVVAKMEGESLPPFASDYTLYLNNGTAAGRPLVRVNGVYCCEDLSDLCNKSDIVNDDSCFDRFQDSSADDSCKDETAAVNNDYKCEISAYCKSVAGTYYPYLSTATVSWHNTARLRNCNGSLKVGGC